MSENNGRAIPCAFIGDGYTRELTIEEDADWHPEVKIEYRPMLIQERQRWFKKIADAKNTEAGERVAAEAAAGQLVSWDIANHRGETVEVSAENVLQLETHLNAKIFNAVTGLSVSAEESDAKN